MNDPGIDRRGFLALGVGALAVAVAPPLLRPHERLVRRTFPVMGTLGEIAIPARHEGSVRTGIEAAITELRRVESLMTRFCPDSDVGRLNASTPGVPVPVSPETADVVGDAIRWAAETGGRFDPCLGRAAELWEPRKGAHPPRSELLAELADGALWRSLEVEGSVDAPVLRRHRAQAALDLGGIAKGFGVDRAADVLAGLGIERALINVGGDLVALGSGPEGRPWRVGIRDPRDPDRLVGTIEAEDEAIATSGDYLRYFDFEGHRYHHLIDPRTASPTRTSVHTVTVRARDARTADAAATAAFNLLGDTASPSFPRRSGIRIVHRG